MNKKSANLPQQALVLQCFGRKALILTTQGLSKRCSIRSNIEQLVAGDRVLWQPEINNHGVITDCLPRESVFGRPNKHHKIKPIAANITQVIIVTACKPSLSWILLDSYLIMADYFNLAAKIVLNKTDLPSNDLQQELITHYEPLNYPIIFTNQTDPNSYQQLENTLHNQISVFVGQSGVGKSSILAQLLPEEKINIAPLSLKCELGQHTTSSTRFYPLKNAGGLIDSPGIREMTLWPMPATELANYYREFKPYISLCKYRNCNHIDAPGCAIITAINNNLISQTRYENYVKLSKELI